MALKEMKQSIKTITVKKMLVLAFAFLACTLLIIGTNFQELINATMQDKGISIARSVENTLTHHMRDSSFEMKEEIIHTANSLPGIQNLKIIRSPKMNNQFSLPSQPLLIDLPRIKKTFTTRETILALPKTFSDPALIEITYPYIATAKYGFNCVTCHDAEHGEVLAVLDFQVDTTEYRWMSVHYLYGLVALYLIALLGIARLIFWVLDKNVTNPLRWLVKRTKESYEHHVDIDTQRIEALELDYFATKVNEFNALVLQRNKELEEINKEIKLTQKEIILAMGNVCETRCQETASHVIRVAEVSRFIAELAGLPEEDCHIIHTAAPMHDMGKIAIPDEILKKPGKFTPDEYKIMQSHCRIGFDIFKHSERPLLKAASIIAHQHHERWDGTGYPQGLKGEEIHIYGRITSIADVFDALISPRCYKKPWEAQKVFDYFKENSGSQFDPVLSQLLIDNFTKAQDIINQYH